MWLAPKIQSEWVADVGCGDGRLAMALSQVCPVKHLNLYDLNDRFLQAAQDCWPGPCQPHFAVGDVREVFIPSRFDIVLFGVLPYVFDDADARGFFKRHAANRIFVRTPCDLADRVITDKMSPALGAHYAAVYRTVGEVRALFNRTHRIVEAGKVWPAEIDSEFKTRQHVFHLEPLEEAI